MGVHNNGTVCSRHCIFHYRFILFIVKDSFHYTVQGCVGEAISRACTQQCLSGISSYQKMCFFSFSMSVWKWPRFVEQNLGVSLHWPKSVLLNTFRQKKDTMVEIKGQEIYIRCSGGVSNEQALSEQVQLVRNCLFFCVDTAKWSRS